MRGGLYLFCMGGSGGADSLYSINIEWRGLLVASQAGQLKKELRSLLVKGDSPAAILGAPGIEGLKAVSYNGITDLCSLLLTLVGEAHSDKFGLALQILREAAFDVTQKNTTGTPAIHKIVQTAMQVKKLPMVVLLGNGP